MASRASGFWNEPPSAARSVFSTNHNNGAGRGHSTMTHSDSAEDYFRAEDRNYDSPEDDEYAEEDEDLEQQERRLLGGEEEVWDGRTPASPRLYPLFTMKLTMVIK